MEAGVAVSASRSSFRKPSHGTSQRNYRRRSPSSRSGSRSTSPPHQASSGGWKRDRSASPSSPRRGGATNSSFHSKKGKRGHTGNDGSDEDSEGRYGDPGPGVSERQVRGASYDRYRKPNFQDSKRSGSYMHERDYSASHGRSYARRNGDYEYSGRSRHSPERGYRHSGRSRDAERRRSRDRDRDRESEAYSKYRSGGRLTDMERETDLEGKAGKERDRDRERGRDRDRERHRESDRHRDRARDRDRERSRRRSRGRDYYNDKDDDNDDSERRYEGSKGRDSKRDRDRDRERERERIKSKSAVRELSTDREVEAGEIDSVQSRETEKDKSRGSGKGSDAEKRKSKSGEREFTNSKNLERDDMDCSGVKGREGEREKYEVKKEMGELNGDMDIDTEKDTLERTRDGDKYRDRESVDGRGGRDLSNVERDIEKDVERNRGKGRDKGRDDRLRDRDDSVSSDRHRDHRDRRRQEDGLESSKARDRKSKEKSPDNRLKDGDEERELSVHREDHKVRDRLQEKEDKSGSRSEKERIGRGTDNSEHISHRDRDRGNSSSYGRTSGNDRRISDATSGKEKIVVKLEKETQPSIRVKEEVDGSYHSETRDGEGGEERKYVKRSQDSSHQVSSVPASASDSDTKITLGLDEKAAKSSKWGPETSDSAVKSSASDELVNDLTAAKLAAMKAAELVNKNLGVGGFMSADQKKRLLWGSKKIPTEQESVATAAGINRWDTVHFSDPDRREKFQKLMSLSVLPCHSPISGREGRFLYRIQERRGFRCGGLHRGEAARVAAGPGEAIYCWSKEARWWKSWPWIVIDGAPVFAFWSHGHSHDFWRSKLFLRMRQGVTKLVISVALIYSTTTICECSRCECGRSYLRLRLKWNSDECVTCQVPDITAVLSDVSSWVSVRMIFIKSCWLLNHIISVTKRNLDWSRCPQCMSKQGYFDCQACPFPIP